MLGIIFFIALIWVVWKLFVLGIKMAWGIAKIMCTVLLFPLFVIGMMLVGMVYIAIPVLIIAGLIAVVGSMTSA